MTESEIRQAAVAVHAARQKAAESRAWVDSLRATWEQENGAWIQQVKADAEERDRAEASLRLLALADHAATGNKHPGPGVDIREVTRLEYKEFDALPWAIEHTMALKLDKSAFEKIAKATHLPFVVEKLEPQATIAADLGKALGETA